MNNLYPDLLREIIAFCDKNTQYNLKFVNKLFRKLIGKIYDNILDFYKNLVTELKDSKTVNYLPIIYRNDINNEYFILACSLLISDVKFYSFIKKFNIYNMKLELKGDKDDLFLFLLNTNHGKKSIIFSVNTLLDIIDTFDIDMGKTCIFNLHKLFTQCEFCSTSSLISNNVLIKKLKYVHNCHNCWKVMIPFSNSHRKITNKNLNKEKFFWSPSKFYNNKILHNYSNIQKMIFDYMEYNEYYSHYPLHIAARLIEEQIVRHI